MRDEQIISINFNESGTYLMHKKLPQNEQTKVLKRKGSKNIPMSLYDSQGNERAFTSNEGFCSHLSRKELTDQKRNIGQAEDVVASATIRPSNGVRKICMKHSFHESRLRIIRKRRKIKFPLALWKFRYIATNKISSQTIAGFLS